MHWLWSPAAIKAHLVFVVAIGLLTWAVLDGDHGPGGDYPLALAFCGIAYPLVLLLVWLQWRINGGRGYFFFAHCCYFSATAAATIRFISRNTTSSYT
jgi:hypothetical protein